MKTGTAELFPSNSRSQWLDGFRGFAALLVFLNHFCTLAGERWSRHTPSAKLWIAPLDRLGEGAVGLFFALSGLLILASLARSHGGVFLFWRRRLSRIMPAYWTVLFLYLLASWILPSASKIPEGSVPAALYLSLNALLLPVIFLPEPMISVSWTLGYELLFYLLVPLWVFWVPERTSFKTKIVTMAAIASAVVCWCALRGGPYPVALFLVGILVHEQTRSGWRLPTDWDRPILGMIGLILSGLLPWSGPAWILAKTILQGASAWLLLSAGLTNEGPKHTARCFSWRPLVQLGRISYSFYLIHGLCLQLVFWCLDRLTSAKGVPFLAVVLALPLASFLSWLAASQLYRQIELPWYQGARKHQEEASRDSQTP
jgi:exopolysaccharide production protein ExoZ